MSFFKSKFWEELQKSKNYNDNYDNSFEEDPQNTDDCLSKDTNQYPYTENIKGQFKKLH